MGSSDQQRQTTVPGDFADTVQSEPPTSAADLASGASALGADSDIGLDITGDAEANVAEKPTLSHIGRYALKTLLGEGGLGCVYEAWDPLLSRTVAVKTLQFDLDMPSRIALDRLLLNEARAAANLNHAHIVTVYDAGLSAHGVYLAMERLRGRDLRQMLADGWHPTPDAAAQIVRRVADALAYAHARGVVHCDIKPGNIFLTPKGKPKVLDFGIARAAHATAPPSGEAPIAGSPHYLAPEQLSGGAIDARTDIYSLGVVLYELLAGRKAFRGETLEMIHARVRAGDASPLRELRPDLPPALCELVTRAMDVDPERRFATASDFSQALRQYAVSVAAMAPAAQPVIDAQAPAPSRRAGWALAAVAAGVAAIAWWALSAQAPAPSPATAVVPAAAPAIVATPAPAPSAAASPPVAIAEAASSAAAEAAESASTPSASSAATAVAPVPVKTAPVDDRPSTAAKVTARADKPTARADKATAQADKSKSRIAAPTAQPTGPAPSGSLQIAVSPWGEVEIDGRPAGTTPPLTQLSLTEGTHTVTIRNTDFPPYTVTVQVQADKPVVVRHRFGS